MSLWSIKPLAVSPAFMLIFMLWWWCAFSYLNQQPEVFTPTGNTGFNLSVCNKGWRGKKNQCVLSFYVCLWRSDPATVNITDEMSKGSFGNVWKSVNPAESTKKEPSAKRLACSHPRASMPLKGVSKWISVYYWKVCNLLHIFPGNWGASVFRQKQPCLLWYPTV